MIMDVKHLIKNKKGQAMIEFLLFLPFMVMMYSVTASIANAINSSINQQKITRGYFYYRAANNSTMPKPVRRGGAEPHNSWKTFGIQMMGWADSLEGDLPVGTCYKFALPLGEAEDDKCNDTYSRSTTQYIRIFTVYGICGATYSTASDGVLRHPSGQSPLMPIGPTACHITQ